MRKTKSKKTITAEDIQKAKKEFFQKGGCIKNLPPQITPHRPNIRLPDYQSTYESIEDLSSF